jgi:hypothetical protein
VDGKPEAQVEPTKVDGLLLAFERERETKGKEKSEGK